MHLGNIRYIIHSKFVICTLYMWNLVITNCTVSNDYGLPVLSSSRNACHQGKNCLRSFFISKNSLYEFVVLPWFQDNKKIFGPCIKTFPDYSELHTGSCEPQTTELILNFRNTTYLAPNRVQILTLHKKCTGIKKITKQKSIANNKNIISVCEIFALRIGNTRIINL